MQGFILATSDEDRLQPLTRVRATSLLPIADQSLLAHQIQWLAQHRIKRIWVHHERLTDGIRGVCENGRRWGVELARPATPQHLGSADALRQAREWLCETCVMLPGDMLIDANLEQALSAHAERRAALTLLLHPSTYGYTRRPVLVQPDGTVSVPAAGAAGQSTVQYTGAAIVEPSILALIPERSGWDIYEHLLPALLASQSVVNGHVCSGYWNPLNSLPAYQNAQLDMLYSAWADYGRDHDRLPDGQPFISHPALASNGIAPGIWVGSKNAIHPSARITPPLYIGHNVLIGQDAEIGPAAVIGSDVIVDNQATVKQSTVLPNTYVGRLVNLDQKIADHTRLIEPSSGKSVDIVDRFLLSEYTPAFAGAPIGRLGDIVGSMAMIILTAPFALAGSLLALIASGGRLLRRVRCVGAVPDAHPGSVDRAQRPVPTFDLYRFQTRRRDGTCSPLGRFVEAWELDRLPELWNVLSGRLSLVGVKPLSPDEMATLSDEDTQENPRFECQPGLTGLWYIQTDANSALDEALIADAVYAGTRDWRMDIKLFFQTPGAWLRRIQARQPSA